MRVAAPAYIVPFMFVYEPSLLMMGDWTTIASSILSGILGVVCLAAGLMGYLRSPCRPWERVLLVIAALLLIKPGYISDAIGLAILVAVGFAQKAQKPAIVAATPAAAAERGD